MKDVSPVPRVQMAEFEQLPLFKGLISNILELDGRALHESLKAEHRSDFRW